MSIRLHEIHPSLVHLPLALVPRAVIGDSLERAKKHTKACLLMGHCVEIGYGLVDDEGDLALLDTEATQRVLSAVHASHSENGIRIAVERELNDDEMIARTLIRSTGYE